MVKRPDSIGWGIVGFGWVAQDFMAPAIIAAGDRLVAIHDPAQDAADAACRYNARACETLDELAADPAVDAVYVATPNHLHRSVVETLAPSGKAILCEKPMAATLDDARAMAQACRSAKIVYRTAFDQRHHPAHIAMRSAVQSGAIGIPTALRIVYACWVGPDWTGDGTARENWRVDPAKAGGGALIDLAPHGLDLASYVLDARIDALTALTQSKAQAYAVDDGAVLIGRTNTDVLLSLHVAYNCPEALPRRRLEIVGTDGQLEALNTMGQTAGGTLHRIDGRSGERHAWSVPDIDVSPFVNQVRAFSATVRANEPSDSALDHDLHIAGLIARAYETAQIT